MSDPANARRHGDENLAAIVASLERFGQAEPLVVQAGTNCVIAGNGRLVAMKKLGWTECDIVEAAVDDPNATALGIALNRTAELADWDKPVLAKLLAELRAENSLDGVGFAAPDLDRLLKEVGRRRAGDGDVPRAARDRARPHARDHHQPGDVPRRDQVSRGAEDCAV